MGAGIDVHVHRRHWTNFYGSCQGMRRERSDDVRFRASWIPLEDRDYFFVVTRSGYGFLSRPRWWLLLSSLGILTLPSLLSGVFCA